ncbi:helix-turn-helix transcriptional regulator [Streptomyces sp. NPDC004610]|uniref:helix-turn-helix transcriptional regulator n=1 Tax=unclassified Streptomyces TaxID=2593676 RepID=UPI0033B1B276
MVDGGAGVLRGALLRLRRTTGLPVAFGGLVEAGGRRMRITELSGTRTLALSALAVGSGNGLGGRAVAHARPCAVDDYPASRRISHEYDVPVAAEGLRSIVAVPVVVRRQVRGVLYGGLRSVQPLGDRTLNAVVEAARDVEQSLLLADDASGVLAEARGARDVLAEARGTGGVLTEARDVPGVREAETALRALAPRIADPALRAELLRACALLTPAPATTAATPLTPREVDVLTCVATGATNAATAARLGIAPETVKSYLRSAMRKLDARTRGEAVARAREGGGLGLGLG